jgi:hypothetical protein
MVFPLFFENNFLFLALMVKFINKYNEKENFVVVYFCFEFLFAS